MPFTVTEGPSDDPDENTDQPPDVSYSLVGYWNADGGAVNSTDGISGTMAGGATFAPGRYGQAFRLDGIDDYVDLGNGVNEQVSNSAEFSVSAWVFFNELSHPPGVNADAPQGDMSIVDKIAGGEQGVNWEGWRLLKQEDGHYWFCLGGSASRTGYVPNGCAPDSPLTVRSSFLALPRAWTQVVAVKAANALRIYVAGQLAGVTNLPQGADTNRNSATLRIGSYIAQGAHLNGLVDEVRLYRRALTPAEVEELAGVR